MKTVYFYIIQGKLGDNLFQYFAAELIKKYYEYDEVKPAFETLAEPHTEIDDEKFKEIITAHIDGRKVELNTRKPIFLLGFFQRSEIFKFEREFIRSLFTLDNNSHISNRVTIANILKYQTRMDVQPTADDLTIHIQCGEFWVKNRSQIYHPSFLKSIVSAIPHKTLYVISEPMFYDWEKDYLKDFKDEFKEYSPVFFTPTLGDSFDFLLRSTKLITSASPLAWMAGYLSTVAEQVHIPYNTYYGGVEGFEQSLAEFDTASISQVYHNVKYWYPSLEICSDPSESAKESN